MIAAASARPLGRSRSASLSAILALALPASLVAATLDGRPKYYPPSYGPGETVTVLVPIAPESGEELAEMSLVPGSGLPLGDGLSDPELLGLDIAKSDGRWNLRARFVAWSPVEGTIEGFRAGGIGLPAIPYRAVARLRPEDIDPTSPRPQELPPGAAFALYGLLGGLAALGLAVFGFVAYLLPAARRLIARWKAGQAFRRLSKSLDYLAAQAGSADPAAYSAALGRALRNYLAARFLPQAPALTPGELSALSETDFPAPSTRDRTAALLSWMDELRFGGAPVRAAELEEAADKARRVAAENEEALLARP